MIRIGVACVLLSGCQLFFRQTPEAIGCRTNSECVTGEICFFRACVASDAEVEAGLLVETTPPAQIGQPAQQRELVVQRGRAVIEWTALAHRFVQVRDPPGHRIPGQFIFTRAALIPGRPTSFAVVKTEAGVDIDLEPGEYDVTLLPSQTISFTPPLRLEPWTVLENEDITQEIPYPGTVSQLFGRFTTTKTDPLFPGYEGAAVYAQLAGDPLISTVATTNNEGRFIIGVLGTTGAYTLTVGPSNKNSKLPEVVFTKDSNGDPLTLKGNAVLPDFYLGNVGAPIDVRGVVRDRDGAPVPNVSITARAPMLSGFFRAAAVTDSNGAFSLELLRNFDAPAVYTIQASAPPGTAAGSGTTTYELPALNEAPPIALTLSQRIAVTITVKDSQAREAPGVSTVITSAASGTRLSAQADAAGSLTVFLDPGVHSVAVAPRPGTRLARASFAVQVDDENTSFDLSLPPAALVAGELKTPSDRRFASATIEFYRVIDDRSSELVGVASVDDENHFSVALPAK